jgi:hypothetical protein
MFYTFLRTHRRGRHANRSYGKKDTPTDRFTHKTISFMYLNGIKTYIRYFIEIII